MTMFNKVFGSQMAAAKEADDGVETVAMPEQEMARHSDKGPLLAPTPYVLTTREKEIAERRSESEADRIWREKSEAAKAAAAPIATAPPGPPPAQPPRPARAMLPEAPTTVRPPAAQPAPTQPEVPTQATAPAPQTARPASNARTRLLGFGTPEDIAPNPMEGPAAAPLSQQFPTGWIVVVEGPGRGHFFPLFSGVSAIGRDENQAISLDFGDVTISRENHASIAYDTEDNCFYVGHGGKSNIVRLNSKPLLSTESLSHGDKLRVGETVLQFVAFCGPNFNWAAKSDD